MDFFQLNFRNVCEGYILKYFLQLCGFKSFYIKKYKTFSMLTDTVTSTRVGIEKTRVCVETRHPHTCIAIR